LLKCTSSTACNPIQGAQLQGRTATFQVRDGGPLDADGQANGRIQDPVALGVPAPSPDFSIALNPDALTVPQGGSGTTTLTLTPQNGFTGQVTLTLERQDGTPAPSGIGLSPGSVNVTGSGPVTQTLTVSVGSSVAAGSYALRVKATSGNLTHYANLSLTVTELEPQGVLDESFGTGGKVLVDLEPGYGYRDRPTSMLIQPDGKITMAGARVGVPGDPYTMHLSAARYNPDGSVDTAFASGGLYLTKVGRSGTHDWFGGADLTPDGGVVLAVMASMPYHPEQCQGQWSGDVVVVKLDTHGNEVWRRAYTLLVDDRGTPNPCDDYTTSFQPERILVDPQGRILIAGWQNGSLGNITGFLLRLLPDGSPDANFGQGGKVLVPGGTTNPRYNALALLPDGRILAGGSAVINNNTNFLVARYNPDGTLDTTFGDGGYAIYDLGTHETVRDIKPLPDGKLLLAINVGIYRTGICRLNPDGIRDEAFRCGTVHDAGIGSASSSLALQPNGKILLVAGDLYAYHIYRLKAEDGSDDAHWAFNFGGQRAYGYNIAYLPSGRILVGGMADNGSLPDFALLRLR
ncbi:choice-of-anchor U domain-containing protein, partial [Thermus antranikianii]